MPRKVLITVFEGFQLLDAAGPLAAFEMAGRLAPGAYVSQLVSRDGDLVRSSVGAVLETVPFAAAGACDTFMIVGGEGVTDAAACPATLAFVRARAAEARRTASVCSGAYVLATAGLLDGRRATTHWQRGPDFLHRFPGVRLDADRIFVKDGDIWTSAGISAGIDLSLALVAEDLGEDVARQVAAQLVVYYRRPGGQSQYSALLDMAGGGRFAGLLDHIRRNLDMPLKVDDLAAQAGMSPRHFARVFTAEVGATPARAVERLRVEAASAALESGAVSVQAVARRCGFADPERMRRAFIRLKGVPPSGLLRRETA
ncbi:GlxA family transcriptional regulator [Novispirillum sp. DQ9]|uniref:GlxA family transcriptional regulator n=1 Tax=Novispirillum sp. DQ9 TaxID=3398612 RepID=UPI003C7A3F17